MFHILEKLDTSKSNDIDGFANEMIKKTFAGIAEPLTFIFNLSFACPSGWRKH